MERPPNTKRTTLFDNQVLTQVEVQDQPNNFDFGEPNIQKIFSCFVAKEKLV